MFKHSYALSFLKKYKTPIGCYLIWRLLILLYQMCFQNSLIPDGTYAINSYDKIIVSFAKYWDSIYYQEIAQSGYTHIPQQNFFPLLPLLLWISNLTIQNIFITSTILHLFNGVIISILFYKISSNFSSQPKINLLIFLTFPGSFFIIANYAEGILITLILTSILLIENKLYFLSSIIASLASATKLIGIFVNCFLIMSQTTTKKKIVYTLIGSTGLIAYMLFLQINYNNPLYFLVAQEEWCKNIEKCTPTFPLFTPFINAYAMLNHPQQYTTLYLDLIYTFLFFILIIIIYLHKKLPLKYLLFSLLAQMPWLSTGKITSMTRYLIISIPLFLILSEVIPNKKIQNTLILSHFAIQLILISLFSNYLWAG